MTLLYSVAHLVGCLFILYLCIRIFVIVTSGKCVSPVCLVGKTALITGGSQGLGYQTALNLASRGCRVIIADVTDGTDSVEKLIKSSHNENIIYKHIDLGSFNSIRNFAKDINETEEKLDILVNNAGSFNFGNRLSEDNLHLGMQVNHYGGFLLTYLLVDLLKKSAPSRIVFVSSMLSMVHNLNEKTLIRPDKKHLLGPEMATYCNTKLCNIITADCFADKLREHGVTSNSLHPGLVYSRIFERLEKGSLTKTFFYSFVLPLLSKNVREGAQTAIHLAVSESVKSITGKFFSDCKPFKKPSLAYDKEFCQHVWETSVKLCQLKSEELEMCSSWKVFRLLMWKSYKQQVHHPVTTLMCLLVPVAILIAHYNVALKRNIYPHNDTVYEPFSITIPESPPTDLVMDVIYSPCNKPYLERIVSAAALKLSIKFVNCVRTSAMVNANSPQDTLCAITFNNAFFGNTELFKEMDIVFRFPGELRFPSNEPQETAVSLWATDELFSKDHSSGPRVHENIYGADPVYASENFLSIQMHVCMELIKTLTFKNNNTRFEEPIILMGRFPYPPWKEQTTPPVMRYMLSVYILVMYLFQMSVIVRDLTVEKQTQVKELMKKMGTPTWTHWLTWFIRSSIILLPANIVLMIIICSIIISPNPTIVVFLVLFYSLALICQSFAISAFFTNATVAQAFSILLFYMPFWFVNAAYSSNKGIQCIIAFIPNLSINAGIHIMVQFDSESIKMTFLHLFTIPENNLMMIFVFVFLLMDAIIYLLIALYVEAIFPGKYGVRKVWYFLFTSEYWKSASKRAGNLRENIDSIKGDENEPNLIAGIQVIDLSRKFGENFVVKEFNLNIFEGQITVLLGHNGAGKSTVINMLSGLLPPTSGTAFINGYDINTDFIKIRETLGLCLQTDVLFTELTVREHLHFFSMLKGCNKKEMKEQTAYYMSMLQIEGKKNVYAKNLSAGMKRKLCLAIALCGKTKTVFLDEPSSGVDPGSRRLIWDLLEREKKNKTIILTTHFLDEADLLGDRIAIMANGELQACGSGYFLKKKYGTGYHLIMVKSPICRVELVTTLLKRYIPTVKIEQNVASELKYTLSEEYLPRFEDMLRDLESTSIKLGITSYGIAMSSLEEVFMKIGVVSMNTRTSAADIILFDEGKTSKFKCFLYQMSALFMKRIIYTTRHWLFLLVQIFYPIIWITLGLNSIEEITSSLPKLDIKLESYTDPIVLVNGSNAYKKAYINYVQKQAEIIDIGDGDLITELLRLANEDIIKYRKSIVVAATFTIMEGTDAIIGWFNNVPLHTPPLSLALIMNAIIQTELDNTYDLRISNFPFPLSIQSIVKMNASKSLQIPLFLQASLVVSLSLFVSFYIKERLIGAKDLQVISGVSRLKMMLANLIWDGLIATNLTMTVLLTLVCYQREGYRTQFDIGKIWFLMLLLCYSILCTGYFVGSIASTAVAAFTVMLVLAFVGIILHIVLETVVQNHPVLSYLLSPYINMREGLDNLYETYTNYHSCKHQVKICVVLKQLDEEICGLNVCQDIPVCCNVTEEYFAFQNPGCGLNVLMFITSMALMLGLTALIEYKTYTYVTYPIAKKIFKWKKTTDVDNLDSDVLEEKEKILTAEGKPSAILLKGVTKYFKKLVAVQDLYLAIRPYECFGLLGANGAGKTTVFQILTGINKASFGELTLQYVKSKSRTAIKSKEKMHKQPKISIGYCPQFDALIPCLTPRETLVMFALIRGLEESTTSLVAERIAREFDFEEDLDITISLLSGGAKRKVSTALSFVGDPDVVLLDEPTTGVDPASKRYIWNNINRAREKGKCIILSSHSMDECEALCTRIGIMVNGSFVCLGPDQHLKNKFCKGYSIIIKFKKYDSTYKEECLKDISDFILSHFPTASISEIYRNVVTFLLPDTTVPWSSLFGIMEKGRKQLVVIEDYSLCQCTLEQIFLQFTKIQRRTSIYVPNVQ